MKPQDYRLMAQENEKLKERLKQLILIADAFELAMEQRRIEVHPARTALKQWKEQNEIP